MTFYQVLRRNYYDNWAVVRNRDREDGRWLASDPDQAARFASAQLARDRKFSVPFIPGEFLAIPQHRFTQITVFNDGSVKRNAVKYAEEHG